VTLASISSGSPDSPGQDQLPEFVKGLGDDGVEYTIQPFNWDVDKACHYYPLIKGFGIHSDDIPDSVEGFLTYVVAARSLWFEVLNDKGENVGFIYLSDLLKSFTENRYINATFHAITWDAKAAPRRVIAGKFIRKIFEVLRLHRLTAMIPAKFTGAIRTAKKLGFKDEGRLRAFRRYNNVWFDVIVLSILESEVDRG
jgi:hypothetical protein